MSSSHVSLAQDDADTAVAMVPTLVPSGWTGLAANACQTDLDEAVLLLSGLDALLTTAYDAISALDDMAAD
ncbi:MAG: hypothetical protein Q4C85_02975 [Actinomyces sp.]|uniref:hypothetical protein n=1 Tax=Actinomyces sp. TaxID=29317 RepID=UPI0026DD10CB|nr:hypothetical protein [Actinomyces sp.]MDO4242717.1 hypothetical protein [Actinomyces sp.]